MEIFNETLISVIEILFFICFWSIVAMEIYLIKEGVHTLGSLIFSPDWIINTFEYRDHTKKKKGKTGIWYYMFWFIILILFLISLFIIALALMSAHWAIILAVAVGCITIVPALGYSIYIISKKSYY